MPACLFVTYTAVQVVWFAFTRYLLFSLPPSQALCDYGIEQGSVCEEVCDLLEHIWQEAVGELEQALSVPMNIIKADQVSTRDEIMQYFIIVNIPYLLFKPCHRFIIKLTQDQFIKLLQIIHFNCQIFRGLFIYS